MQGGLSDDTAPHEFGATATATSSSSAPSVAAYLPEWMDRDDVYLLASAMNVVAGAAWLLAAVAGVMR